MPGDPTFLEGVPATLTAAVRQAPCFFLQAAFLKRLPADVRSHLVQNRTSSNPLTLALCADEISEPPP